MLRCGRLTSSTLDASYFADFRTRSYFARQPRLRSSSHLPIVADDRAIGEIGGFAPIQPHRRAGVSDRVQFHIAKAKEYPCKSYDFVAVFDCLHDMGDPAGAARHVLSTLKSDGTWMIVEPFAHDDLADNLNPVGRVYYGGSTLLCTPCSRSQEVGLCLGAQAGEARLRDCRIYLT
jgi:hypothetical protein